VAPTIELLGVLCYSLSQEGHRSVMIRNLVIFTLLTQSLGIGSHADPVTPALTEKSDPKYGVVFVTTDGNQFAFYEAHSALFVPTVDYSEIEDTCSDPLKNAPLAKCHLKLPFVRMFFYAKWIQHKDPSKIGQVVIASDSSKPTPDMPLSENDGTLAAWVLNQTKEFPQVFPESELNCDSWDWISEVPKDPNNPSDSLFASVTQEQMSFTPDTQTTENQGTLESFELRLKKLASGNYEVESEGVTLPRGLLNIAQGPAYISAQTVLYEYLRASDQKSCQVSFGMSLANINQGIGDPAYLTPIPGTEQINQAALLPSISFTLLNIIHGAMNPATTAHWSFK